MGRALALLVALLGACAAPMSALAHGHAHEHEADEHGEVAQYVAIAEHRDHGTGEHAHPLIGTALTSKVATALVTPRVMLPSATAVPRVPPIADAGAEHRTQLAQAPPPRLRAPPA